MIVFLKPLPGAGRAAEERHGGSRNGHDRVDACLRKHRLIA